MKHMYYRWLPIIFLIQCLVWLPGCTFLQWGAMTFRQADKVTDEYAKSMSPFIKSTVIYDQFASIAEFSVLCLTDQARMIYADYFFHRNFKSQEEQDLARQRLLIENDHYITFYVVGYQPPIVYPSGRALFSGEYQIQGPLLGTPDSNWKVSLIVNGVEYAPNDIRSVRLPTEYQHFFGIHWNQFKVAYKVRFDAYDEAGQNVMPYGNNYVALRFSSVQYDAKIEWRDLVYQARK